MAAFNASSSDLAFLRDPPSVLLLATLRFLDEPSFPFLSSSTNDKLFRFSLSSPFCSRYLTRCLLRHFSHLVAEPFSPKAAQLRKFLHPLHHLIFFPLDLITHTTTSHAVQSPLFCTGMTGGGFFLSGALDMAEAMVSGVAGLSIEHITHLCRPVLGIDFIPGTGVDDLLRLLTKYSG